MNFWMIIKFSRSILFLFFGSLIFFSIRLPLKANEGPTVSYRWGDGRVMLTLEAVQFVNPQSNGTASALNQILTLNVGIENQGTLDLYYASYHFWLESDNLPSRLAPISNSNNQSGFLPAGETTLLKLTFVLPPGQTAGLRLIYKPIAFLDEEVALPVDPQPSIIALSPPSPTPTPDYTNKILFWSDRPEGVGIYSMDPDGRHQTLINDYKVYYEALETDHYSPDGCNKLFVREVCGPGQLCFAGDQREVYYRDPQIWAHNFRSGQDFSLVGAAPVPDYDPVWSPDSVHIAFVSEETGNDEIHIYHIPTNWNRRLTENSFEWDKHPTFSPDGQQIAFWSNRDTGRRQIWLMNIDGENQHNISNNPYNDWKPVWWKPRKICQP